MYGLAPIIEHRQITDDVFLLGLCAPEAARQAAPGQFVMLRVAPGLDPLLARPFSIHAVQDDLLFVLYRAVGRGTRLLSRSTVGQEMPLWGPLGHGFTLGQRRPVLVAGGMGVAPLRFVAQRLLAQGVSASALCGLPGAMGFTGLIDLVDDCLATDQCAVAWATEDGSLGAKGLVTELLDLALADCDGVLACGPMPMLRAVALACAQRGAPCQVSLEAPMACGVGACLGCVTPAAGGGYLRVCQEGPVLPAEAVDWPRLG